MHITPFNNNDDAVKIYTPPSRNSKAKMQNALSEDNDNVRIYSIRSHPQSDSSSDNSSDK
ncbi:MAG: hypothetical protein IKM49_01085 [Ruminococcus sp.]|nr:hypothetical protein [Ruminococcus sp.]